MLGTFKDLRISETGKQPKKRELTQVKQKISHESNNHRSPNTKIRYLKLKPWKDLEIIIP